MKRLLVLLLACIMCLGLVACGEEEKKTAPAPAEKVETEAVDMYDDIEDSEAVRKALSEPAPAPTENLPEPEIVEDGFKAMEQDGKWGFADDSGELVIGAQFDEAYNFVGGYASVCIGGKWGIIDDEGAYVVQCEYEEVSRIVSEGFVAVKLNGKWGYVDATFGHLIITTKFDEAGAFQNGKARVVLEGQEAYVGSPY